MCLHIFWFQAQCSFTCSRATTLDLTRLLSSAQGSSPPSLPPAMEENHREISQDRGQEWCRWWQGKNLTGWDQTFPCWWEQGLRNSSHWVWEHILSRWSLKGQIRLANCTFAVVFHIKRNWLQISKPEQHSPLCNNLVKTHFYQSASHRENNWQNELSSTWTCLGPFTMLWLSWLWSGGGNIREPSGQSPQGSWIVGSG